jgi:hypothetical protein
MKTTRLIWITLIIFTSVISYSQNNITITDNSSHNADVSSVLDVYSTSKGMLIPRMNTSQINTVSSPATGLLVFNTDENSFWFFNGTTWDDLSSGSTGLWNVNPSSGAVYLKNTQTNVGIGTTDPIGKLSIVGNSGANPDNPLFEVKDEFGVPIFSVTSEGVRIYVKTGSKGATGGFAVGKYGIVKGFSDSTFLLVTPDSTRVFMQNNTNGTTGGFAVGKYGTPYTGSTTVFYTDPDSTRVYTVTGAKGSSGGFAVGKYGIIKGSAEEYLHLTQENYLIGHRAGDSITSGLYNIFLGYESGISDTSGSGNIFIGHLSGYSNKNGYSNVFMGNNAGRSNTTGIYNVFLGNDAGSNSTQGSFNVFIGNSAGDHVSTGISNVLIGRMAGYAVNEGSNNVFLGAEAGKNVTSGSQNIFLGYLSGNSMKDGYGNFMAGSECGYLNQHGRYNVFLGERAGYNNTGEYNVFLGNYAGYYETGNGKLYISNTEADQNNALIYGDFVYKTLQFNVNVGGTEGKVNINNVLKLTPRNTAPPSPEKGDLYFDGTTNMLKCYDGSQWRNLW